MIESNEKDINEILHLDWWKIGETQFVHLTPLACKIIEKRGRDKSALARLLMLSSPGVLIRQRIGNKVRYYLAKRDLPEELSLNTIRRDVGWR